MHLTLGSSPTVLHLEDARFRVYKEMKEK